MNCCECCRDCTCCQKQQAPSQEQINQITQLCAAAGIIKRSNEKEFVPIKVAFHPLRTSMDFYLLLQSITKAWQKLIFLASRNKNFLQKVYEHISTTDPMVSNLLRIKKKKDKDEDDILFNFTRSDYFINKEGVPKLIEYNLMSVSMTTHIQRFQQIKRLTERNYPQKFIENRPNKALVDSIKSIYESKNLKGYFLLIVHQKQTNIVQQRAIEMQLLRRNIYSKRITLLEAGDKLSIDSQNDLRLGDDLISFVYFRSGYQLEQYQVNWQKTWYARETIEMSNAIKIPTIVMDLFNQKRMQVELSKEQVYSQYLTKQECDTLKLSLVKYWQFDHITQPELQKLLTTMKQNENGYVLKPNLEGGGNNYFGKHAYQKLRSSNEQERKKYILMQKIYTCTQSNLIVNCYCSENCICDYQISRYGVIIGQKDVLKQNKVEGFLIRIKCDTSNQGGIMSGGGSLCSWMIDK